MGRNETGTSVQEKVRINITIEVESLDDVQYDVEAGQIRIKGKNKVENEHLKVRCHTLHLHDRIVHAIQRWTHGCGV